MEPYLLNFFIIRYCSPFPHQEGPHEFIDIPVQDALRIRGGIPGPQVFDQFIGMKDIIAYLGPPLDPLLLAFELSLLLLAFF